MKRIYILYTVLAIFMASCSTQYKSSQTPDDVYYSPAPAADVAKKDENKKQVSQNKYLDYANSEDRYLRMKVANYNRWSSLDDYGYWYDTRYDNSYQNNSYLTSYNHNIGYNNCLCNSIGYSSIFYPGYYNPYIGNYYTGYYNSNPYVNVYIVNPKVIHPNVSRPQLGSYLNTNYSNTNTIGSSIKKIFSLGNSNSNNNGIYRPTERTYTPSSSSSPSSSGSSSGSSSSGGRVSRPGKN